MYRVFDRARLLSESLKRGKSRWFALSVVCAYPRRWRVCSVHVQPPHTYTHHTPHTHTHARARITLTHYSHIQFTHTHTHTLQTDLSASDNKLAERSAELLKARGELRKMDSEKSDIESQLSDIQAEAMNQAANTEVSRREEMSVVRCHTSHILRVVWPDTPHSNEFSTSTIVLPLVPSSPRLLVPLR